ncbi:MAG: hypothetical protein NDF57_06220, partial [archaeon GBS-70-058]|nr:hypothetical protein [Candidatus Culexarchaeum nevadense]
MKTDFKALAELCEKLESMSRRGLMVSEVAAFLRGLDVNEISPAVSMILGRAFPLSSGLELNVSWSTVLRVLRGIVHGDWRVFTDAFKKTGDVGSAIKLFLESSRVSKQTTLTNKRLTIIEVKRFFEEIAKISGKGARDHKARLLESLFSLASPIEMKYIVRVLIGEMRTGFSEGLMKEAISEAFNIPLETISRAMLMVGDLEVLAEIAKRYGLDGFSKLEFKVFRPIKPMLAKDVGSL